MNVFYEPLVLRLAYEDLAGHLTTNPQTASPKAVYRASQGKDFSRLAALMYAYHYGDSLAEAEINLLCVLAFAARGRRPRSLVEMGLVPSRARSTE